MINESYIQWCNDNEGRAYPIHEDASQLDDQGQRLPTDMLADMCIMVPPEYKDARIASVRYTPDILAVSVACPASPLLICTVARADYTVYSPVAMTPLVSDVSGWVVFGNYTSPIRRYHSFASTSQSGLAVRAVRVVERVPVSRFSKLHGDPQATLERLVRLLGGSDLRVYRQPGLGGPIVVELTAAQADAFLGPCNDYGDGGNCPIPPICSINGVTADANGTITLRFKGTR